MARSLRPLPGETEIETSAQAWAYAAAISFEAQGASAVEVEVVVLQGCVGFTLFGPTLWEIGEQAVVKSRAISTRVVILQLRDPSEVQGLLIRNGPNAAPSIARITAVRVLRRER